MTQLIFAIAITITSLAGFSQTRYLESIIDSVKIDTYTYAFKDGNELKLDIYLPAFDSEDNKPLLLFVHGGGFSGGSRGGETNHRFCSSMAERGYVAVSMSYRLTRKGTETGFGCDCPALDKLNTFEAAVEDIQDATFFLIDNRQEFGIDPHKIILMGSSAGAEAVLNAAYKPENCYDLPSGPVSYAGVISMAGAIHDTSLIYDESAIPSMFFHGTCDNLVPYATAPHHYCDKGKPGYLILYGAKTISEKLEELEVPYWLYTVCGGGHEVAGTPMYKYFDAITEFCYEYVVLNKGINKHTIIPIGQTKCDYAYYKYCEE